ncbi:MAG TPA: hypothetical protein VIJ64_09655 [Candidatus Lustribacter sp.]
MNAQQRSQRNARLRRTLLRVFVWAILVVFVLTSVGVALVNFTSQ